MTFHKPARVDGYAPLSQYGVLGDGRSVALVAADGSIDWWCVPQLDAPPFFARLLQPDGGGHFTIAPAGSFQFDRGYRPDSNVLETTYTTDTGTVRVTESLNSGVAGRLPWSELARRVECLDGHVQMSMTLHAGTRFDSATAWVEATEHGDLLHLDGITAMLCHDERVECEIDENGIASALFEMSEGERTTIALIATENEPLLIPPLAEIDNRIDSSDNAWKEWTGQLTVRGPYAETIKRSALALKFLLFSPSGAIAAAATTSLPSRLDPRDGEGNYDYRFAWVRDAAYTIRALIRVGADQEIQATLAWLLKVMREHGPEIQIFYSLDAELDGEQSEIEFAGYQGSKPVRVGNTARDQQQLSLYGDIIGTVALFVSYGNVLDLQTGRLLADLADRCADDWLQKDSSIWEFPEKQHYTISKIGCWMALTTAADLARNGNIDATRVDRWESEARRIAAWVDDNCWSDEKQAYTQYAGSDRLDAALLLAVAFGFDRRSRLASTVQAIQHELSDDGLVYRHTGARDYEGAFLACSFWLVEAKALFGDVGGAHMDMKRLLDRTGDNLGLMNEMIRPDTNESMGNFPQGLSHLAFVNAAAVLDECEPR